MSKKIFCLGFLTLALVACGNGHNDENNVGGPYGYGQNALGGGLCSSTMAEDWNILVASRCNQEGTKDEDGQGCVWGARKFQERYAGISCQIAVDRVQWSPNNNWQNQQFFTINDEVFRNLYAQHGITDPNWAGNGQVPVGPGVGFRPGFPGRPGFPRR